MSGKFGNIINIPECKIESFRLCNSVVYYLFLYNLYLSGVKHKNIKLQIFYFVENFAFAIFF